MTAPTIRQLLADVLRLHIGPEKQCEAVADALLASPELAAIIDLAAKWEGFGWVPLSPEMRALLAAWRADRAEQESER